MYQTISYLAGTELPDLALTWNDDDGTPINFSTGYTFNLQVTSADDITTPIIASTTGFTGASTAPNLTIAWTESDLGALPPGRYLTFISATRTSDDKTRAYPNGPLVLTVTPSPSWDGTAILPTPSSLATHIADESDVHGATRQYAPIRNIAAGSGGAVSSTTSGCTMIPTNTQTQLTIPTYDGSGTVVHPSVILIDNGWNDYRYWMAFTPYPSADSAYENPSIVASNNGTTWVVPAGLTNPIEAKPTSISDYNSDPHLVLGSDGYLYCFWRAFMPSQVGTEERIYYRRSTDGITWGDKTLIMSNDVAVRRLVSPCLLEEPDGTWRMYAVDFLAAPNTIVTLTAATLTGTWSSPTSCTGITVGSGKDAYHLDAHRIGGEYVMVVNDCPLGAASTGDLYRAVSTDGSTWTTDAKPFPPRLTSGGEAGAAYRCAFLPAEVGGAPAYEVMWGTLDTFTRGFVRIVSDYRWQDDPGNMAAAGGNIPPYTAGDVCNRADSGSSPGTATSGLSWTVSAGTVGVSSRALYAVSAANTRAVLDSGISDGEFGLTMRVAPTGTGQGWLVFRLQDSSNYWRFGKAATTFELQSIVSGAVSTQVAYSGTGTIPNDARFRVVCSGDSILCYVDDRLAVSHSSATFNTATSFGFQTASTAPRFTNFYAKRP